MIQEDAYEPAPPPKGARYFFSTWSGRLILINLAVFLYVSWRSGSLFMPDMETLLQVGVKDPVGLAHGEFWRLITPMFIHIGLIHFVVNSFGLYVIGYQLETLLGGYWFLLIYLLSGFAGNVASAVFSIKMSAGASGAIFGLLGCGFYIERLVGRRIKEMTGQRPKNRVYTMTVVMNLALGFIIPFLDNAAHIGGLLMGLVLTMAIFNLRSNRLQKRRIWLGWSLIIILAVFSAVGTKLGISAPYLTKRLERAGDEATDVYEKSLYYSQALAITPNENSLLLKKVRTFLLAGAIQEVWPDLIALMKDPTNKPQVEALINELENTGFSSQAKELKLLQDRLMLPSSGN